MARGSKQLIELTGWTCPPPGAVISGGATSSEAADDSEYGFHREVWSSYQTIRGSIKYVLFNLLVSQQFSSNLDVYAPAIRFLELRRQRACFEACSLLNMHECFNHAQLGEDWLDEVERAEITELESHIWLEPLIGVVAPLSIQNGDVGTYLSELQNSPLYIFRHLMAPPHIPTTIDGDIDPPNILSVQHVDKSYTTKNISCTTACGKDGLPSIHHLEDLPHLVDLKSIAENEAYNDDSSDIRWKDQSKLFVHRLSVQWWLRATNNVARRTFGHAYECEGCFRIANIGGKNGECNEKGGPSFDPANCMLLESNANSTCSHGERYSGVIFSEDSHWFADLEQVFGDRSDV